MSSLRTAVPLRFPASLCLLALAAVMVLLPRGALAQTGHWSITYSTPTGSLDWSTNNGTPQHSSLPLHLKHLGGQSTTTTVWISFTVPFDPAGGVQAHMPLTRLAK
jgi:hypothetical protein